MTPFRLSPFRPRSFWVSPFRLRPFRLRAGVAVLGLAGVCQLAALGYGATRPPAANPEQALAGWLADHHLTTGLGTYTEDNVTTLDSGGTVRLRTVSWPRSGRAAPRQYQSSASWYDPRTAYANFVVSGSGIFLGASGNPVSIGPVSLRTTNQYSGLYALDTFDVTNAFSVSAGGRLNVANIELQDQLGSSLNETICLCTSIR